MLSLPVEEKIARINVMLPNKLAFVDIETTGTAASYGRVIEIGIVRVEDNKVVKTYQTLINPQTHLPPEITILTGITMKELENQPTFREVAKDIQEMIADCVFVAHNVRFDYGFLKHSFLRENMTFSSKHFCTVKLSRILYPQHTHHNLDAIINRFGFECENRHRAFDDAHILWQFYQKSQQEIDEEAFTKAVNLALRRPTVPMKLHQEDLDALPEEPGVYLFFGQNGMPLYIGKSKNIKDRVLSHFSGDIHSTKEMNIAQQVESIETKVTAGELGALFLESSLVKKMLPLYNRKLRIKRELIALTKKIDTNGFETVAMESITTIDVQKLDSFLGFFKSKKQAKEFLTTVVKEYGLCEKLLGLEKTPTACFGYRLNRCKGACVNKESPLFYNLRFTTAFFKTKIKPWPFQKSIMIEEKNEFTGLSEYFLVDKWCYLGSIKTSGEEIKNEQLVTEYTFDLDMYKLLVSFLNKPENFARIKQIDTAQFIKQEYTQQNSLTQPS